MTVSSPKKKNAKKSSRWAIWKLVFFLSCFISVMRIHGARPIQAKRFHVFDTLVDRAKSIKATENKNIQWTKYTKKRQPTTTTAAQTDNTNCKIKHHIRAFGHDAYKMQRRKKHFLLLANVWEWIRIGIGKQRRATYNGRRTKLKNW